MREFFSQYPFTICIVVMLLAEATKHTIDRLTAKVWFRHGGMPSSHSAFVSSLLVIVGSRDGIESIAFAIATVLAGIVWYDAAFVRRQVGKQAKILNLLQDWQAFSERVGHSLAEVFGGIAFGALVTLWLQGWIA